MKKILILAFIVTSFYAKKIDATYHITYGIVGEVGVAKAKFITKDDNTYLINIEANSTGFAKSLSGGRNELFKSEGRVFKSGRLEPKTYTHVTTRMKKKSGFILDPSKWEKVLSKKENVSTFHEDKITERRIKSLDGEILKDKTKTLKYFVKDDLLSLFFNFKIRSNDFNITKTTDFYAVGADKKDGKLEVKPMLKKDQLELFGDESGHNFIAIINKPVFSSNKGELYIKLNDAGIATAAVLKDVLFFGDIKATLVNSSEK